ncbi:hypothetical protein ARMSODRAFT_960020 [Armillaria solidipes]|uniref:Peptidase C14 caspase domain-containing protein n=1 Tax=Armillaria solidipes TaxID=1076256 RepID=A0A2H3B7L1_9AGAR|nr:hypothetical protein ARMSODRAFT_967202 [Armillaria solidipes]PBK66855.1 hypothetical protein ARMSODRAFT_960020 [Armillaria solidipes]
MNPPLYLESYQNADHSSGSVSPLRVNSRRQFWAVIIGIDEYPNPRDVLHGCVCDATNVFNYLTTNMGVPKDHIKLLLGPLPTSSNVSSILLPIRTNIIDALLSLSTNSRIHYGDNIIIYYAGHGTVYHCKDHPPFASLKGLGGGTIEALCPMDRNTTDTHDGTPVPDISDRELYTILDEICRTKGHHITVILDCCHSSSQTRVPEGLTQGMMREARPMSEPTSIEDMFAIADKKLGELKTDDGSKPRYLSISRADWLPELPVASHVILAACQAYEYAKELPGGPARSGGVFTSALLCSLKSIIAKPADLKGTLPTYLKLVGDLDLEVHNGNQHPAVAGKCKDKPLWYTGPHCSCSP